MFIFAVVVPSVENALTNPLDLSFSFIFNVVVPSAFVYSSPLLPSSVLQLIALNKIAVLARIAASLVNFFILFLQICKLLSFTIHILVYFIRGFFN